MADSEKYHFARIMDGFDLGGNVVRTEPDVAVRIVRFLGDMGYVCAGGVFPGQKFGDKSDANSEARFISNELGNIQQRHGSKASEFVAGPHVLGIDDENGPTYYPRGAMLFARPQPDSTEVSQDS